MSSTAMKHLEVLTQEIGPRGSTTQQEKSASEYARRHFESLGLETSWEPFRSPKTGWRQFFLASIFSVIAVFLGLFAGFWGAWAAVIISAVTTASVLMELYFRPNLLRLLVPKGDSQNVWARVPAGSSPLQKILVLGHVDTHRTPWVFETPRRLSFFRTISTLGTASFALIGILFLVIGIFSFEDLRWISLIFIPILLIGLGMTWQADRTPFTEGANDNGSGSTIVMSFADQFSQEPFQHTEIWLLVTGCEEVGSYGAQAFFAQHKDTLGDFEVINVDNVGGQGAGVCYITVEGMLIPLRPSARLLSVADTIRREWSDVEIYSKPFTTLHTDATCFMSHRIPSLSFVGLTPEGVLPNWHKKTDTLENTSRETIEAVDRFIAEMIRKIDQSLAA